MSAIDHALVAAGHRSVVVAQAGSAIAGEHVPVPAPPGGDIDDAARETVHRAVRDAVARCSAGADVVHLHGIDFHAYLPPPGPPALVTLHLPPDWYPDLHLARPRTWLHAVSPAQARACPPGLVLLPPIGNGVPVDRLGAARHACRGYAVMLGRICPEKGQHLALAAAHQAGITLLLAGEVFPYAEHRRYFMDQVSPLLDQRRRYLGPVGFDRKRRILGAAKCLLAPSLAAETSSLAVMEALACGTPAIAFRAGALPDIVDDGETGFIVDDASAMADAIARVDTIDRGHCRAVARDRFSVQRMTGQYIERYRQLSA